MVSVTRIKPNSSKTTANPPSLRLTLADYSYHYRSKDVVFKSAAKKKTKSVKYNKVFINKYLTNEELVQLKKLITARNDSNQKLEERNASMTFFLNLIKICKKLL